jgi:hypothetical protein
MEDKHVRYVLVVTLFLGQGGWSFVFFCCCRLGKGGGGAVCYLWSIFFDIVKLLSG